MARGRKPTPTAILKVRGSQIRNRADEPQPTPGVAGPPSHLSTGAKRAWRWMASELEAAGIVGKTDRPAFALLCQSWARWVEAEGMVKETGGDVLKASEGGGTYQNPWRSVSNRAHEQVARLLVEFGGTPSSRTKVVKLDAGGVKTGAARFIKMA